MLLLVAQLIRAYVRLHQAEVQVEERGRALVEAHSSGPVAHVEAQPTHPMLCERHLMEQVPLLVRHCHPRHRALVLVRCHLHRQQWGQKRATNEAMLLVVAQLIRV